MDVYKPLNLQRLIEKLEKLREEHGGDMPVIYVTDDTVEHLITRAAHCPVSESKDGIQHIFLWHEV